MIALNMRVKMIDRSDYDYSTWLGPNYKENQKLPIKVATHIAAPHASYLDNTLTQYVENHAFCIKAETEKVPLIRDILGPMQVFYIDRNAGDEVVKQIIER